MTHWKHFEIVPIWSCNLLRSRSPAKCVLPPTYPQPWRTVCHRLPFIDTIRACALHAVQCIDGTFMFFGDSVATMFMLKASLKFAGSGFTFLSYTAGVG